MRRQYRSAGSLPWISTPRWSAIPPLSSTPPGREHPRARLHQGGSDTDEGDDPGADVRKEAPCPSRAPPETSQRTAVQRAIANRWVTLLPSAAIAEVRTGRWEVRRYEQPRMLPCGKRADQNDPSRSVDHVQRDRSLQGRVPQQLHFIGCRIGMDGEGRGTELGDVCAYSRSKPMSCQLETTLSPVGDTTSLQYSFRPAMLVLIVPKLVVTLPVKLRSTIKVSDAS